MKKPAALFTGSCAIMLVAIIGFGNPTSSSKSPKVYALRQQLQEILAAGSDAEFQKLYMNHLNTHLKFRPAICHGDRYIVEGNFIRDEKGKFSIMAQGGTDAVELPLGSVAYINENDFEVHQSFKPRSRIVISFGKEALILRASESGLESYSMIGLPE